MNTKKIAVIALLVVLIVVTITTVAVFLKDSGTTEAHRNDIEQLDSNTIDILEPNGNNAAENSINENTTNLLAENVVNNEITNSTVNNSTYNNSSNTVNSLPESTTIESERVISESLVLSWNAKSLSNININSDGGIYYSDFAVAKTAQVIKAEVQVDEEQANIASVGDTIRYTLTVKNTGTLPLQNINIKDDMLDIEKQVTIPVGYEYSETIDYIVTETDAIKSLENDKKIFNTLVAKYGEVEKEITTVTVINLKYKYAVEHYKQNLDMKTYILADTDHLSGILGEYTNAMKKEYVGFNVNAFEQQLIKGDNSTIVKIYYDRLTDLSYTVNYLEQGTDKVLAPAKTLDGQTFGTEVTENAIDIEGYNKVDPTTWCRI